MVKADVAVHGEGEQLKSAIAIRVPPVTALSLPLAEHEADEEGEHASVELLPPQKPNASFVPSWENLGVTAEMLLQPATVIAVLGSSGSYSREKSGGARQFLSP
jgi:hypothetical protein